MGRFAAIEARCTQYPASTNDVVWLVHRVRELRDALDEVLVGLDEVLLTRESVERAEAALAALEEPNVPI